MNFLTIPDKCPVCGGHTEIRNSISAKVLFCTNPNCVSKLEGKLIHFVGASGLDIESMSIATVRDLIKLGWLTKMSDIFTLKIYRDEWIALKGYGVESVDKILEAIPTSIELWKVIASAGIENVEKSTSKRLAKHFSTYEAFRQAVFTGYDFTKIKDIGPTIAANIAKHNYVELDEVMKYLTIKEEVTGGKLANMSFCITGKLSMKRDDIVKLIESNGGKIASVNKNLTYLICNDKNSNSGKSKKAKDLGIKIISEEDFNSMLIEKC